MNRFGFSNKSARDARTTDSFERSRRQRGGSARSYSERVHTPARMKADQQKLIVLIVLTVVLPPLGIAVMWKGGLLRFPVRIASTLAAFLLMILYFSWMIPESTPDAYQPPIQRPAAVTEYSFGAESAPLDTAEDGL